MKARAVVDHLWKPFIFPFGFLFVVCWFLSCTTSSGFVLFFSSGFVVLSPCLWELLYFFCFNWNGLSIFKKNQWSMTLNLCFSVFKKISHELAILWKHTLVWFFFGTKWIITATTMHLCLHPTWVKVWIFFF